MCDELGLRCPPQLWTGVIEYREHAPVAAPSSSLIAESSRVTLNGNAGTVLSVHANNNEALVQWDVASTTGTETANDEPEPPTLHLLHELQLLADTSSTPTTTAPTGAPSTPPPHTAAASFAGDHSSRRTGLLSAASATSAVPSPAKFGQRQLWGATLTLPSFDDDDDEKEVEGFLDLCDARARILVAGRLSREEGDGARLLVLTEEELVHGKQYDWFARFNKDDYLPGTTYTLRVNNNASHSLSGEFEGGTATFQRQRLFSLDKDAHAPGVCIEEEEDDEEHEDEQQQQRLGLSGEDSHSGVALGQVGFASGVYYWEIRMDQAEEHGTVFVGAAERPLAGTVLPAGVRLPGLSRWERLPRSWGFINFRATQCSINGGVEQIYGEFFETDNVVGVLLDMDQGEISYFIDAIKYGEHVMRDLGVAFSPAQLASRSPPQRFNPFGDAVQYVYPALGLKKNMDNLLSISSKFIAFPSTEEEDAIDSLALLKQVLPRLSSAPPQQQQQLRHLPAKFAELAYAHYKRMMLNRYRRYPSRAGGRLVEVDVSPQAMARACKGHVSPALRVGEVCRTMQSQGRELSVAESALVLGCRMGKVWYQIQTVSNHEGFGDGATWAFYWEGFELGTLQREEEEGAVKEEEEAAPLPPVLLSKQEFMAHCVHAHDDSDEQLVRKVNAALQQQGEQDAMNLDVGQSLVALATAYELGRIAVLRLVNCMTKRALPLLSEHGLGRIVHDARALLFQTTKRAFWDAVLRATTAPTALPGEEYVDPPQIRVVQINRIKAQPSKLAAIPVASDSSAAAAAAALDDGMARRLKRSVFGQLYAETVRWPDYAFRRSYAGKGHGGQKRCFKVKLIGEGVDDYGGPYRQVFEAICDELHNDTEDAGRGLLPLLLPCPNRVHSVGDVGRDKFVLSCAGADAAASSPTLLRRFQFLGKLMGVAMRHGLQLGLHLPELFWAQLVDAAPSSSSSSSSAMRLLEEVDVAFCRDLRRLEADPPSARERKFQVTLSDGKTVVSGGDAAAYINADNVKAYVQFAIQARLNESHAAFAALKHGLASVVPVEHFRLFTAHEMEALVCGTRGLDVGFLQSMTEFEGGLSPQDEHVKWFWEVLEAATLVQREQFLIFAWARSRMPNNRADLLTRFRLQQPSGAAKDRPDDFLPTAQTCFFSLSLPRYSTKAVLSAKFLLAIECTTSMDADVRLRNAEGWAE